MKKNSRISNNRTIDIDDKAITDNLMRPITYRFYNNILYIKSLGHMLWMESQRIKSTQKLLLISVTSNIILKK